MSLKESHRGAPWQQWSLSMMMRIEAVLAECRIELADSIRQGHIAYIINTSNIGATDQIHDGHEIRKLATENNVTLFTSLDTVKVLLDVLDEITLRISTIDA